MSQLSYTHGHAGETAAAHRTMPIFKLLREGKVEVVPHGRNGFPGVDVYELQRFKAAISTDDVTSVSNLLFYVYHNTDATARVTDRNGNTEQIVVETRDDHWHLPFADALRMVGVEYDDRRHLGDVVVDFWQALFSPPSDPFDETSYGVSPWLERNVGDRRTLGSLRTDRGGEWDDIRFRFRPRKTLNWPAPVWGVDPRLETVREMATVVNSRLEYGAPPGVEVLQLDLNHVGLRVLEGGPAEVAVMVLLLP